MSAQIPAQRPAQASLDVARALDAVDPARLVGLLQALVRIPSITGTAAESEAQHAVARLLRDAGADVDLWRIDLGATTTDPEFPGMEAPRDEAWGLVGSLGGDDGPTLVLNGHIDVVPEGDLGAWSTDPWAGELREGRVLGRGTCDMKAGLVCQLVAVEALQAAGVRLRGRLQLQSVVGEEDGGLGTFATLRRGYRGDCALIAEPTSAQLVAVTAGALTFRLRVPGLSAHGSARLSGVDAVEKYLRVHAALRALEARRNAMPHPLMTSYALPYPISVGRVRAGDWPSTVPDMLVAEGRYGVAVGEPVDDARRELEQAVAEVCADDAWLAEHPVEVEWWGGQFASGEAVGGTPLELALQRAHLAEHGSRARVLGVPYGSDQRLLTGIGGVPTLLYGPGDVRHAHSPDEHVAVEEMVQVTRTIVRTVAAMCGTTSDVGAAVR